MRNEGDKNIYPVFSTSGGCSACLKLIRYSCIEAVYELTVANQFGAEINLDNGRKGSGLNINKKQQCVQSVQYDISDTIS